MFILSEILHQVFCHGMFWLFLSVFVGWVPLKHRSCSIIEISIIRMRWKSLKCVWRMVEFTSLFSIRLFSISLKSSLIRRRNSIMYFRSVKWTTFVPIRRSNWALTRGKLKLQQTHKIRLNTKCCYIWLFSMSLISHPVNRRTHMRIIIFILFKWCDNLRCQCQLGN